MKFYPVEELQAMPEDIIGSLSSVNEIIITEGGKPAALMLRITNDNFDEVIQDIKQAKATAAINLKRRQQTEKEAVTGEEKR